RGTVVLAWSWRSFLAIRTGREFYFPALSRYEPADKAASAGPTRDDRHTNSDLPQERRSATLAATPGAFLPPTQEVFWRGCRYLAVTVPFIELWIAQWNGCAPAAETLT